MMPLRGPLVDAQWLQSAGPGVVVVDCRFRLADPQAGRTLYSAGHIPGAVFADMDADLCGPLGVHGGRHPLPDPDALASRLGGWGIAGDTAVVAYDDMGFAARLWWLLRYMGHDRVAVLDGGIQAWVRAGGALTPGAPPARPARVFRVRLRPAMAAGLAEVRTPAAGSVLVDARAPERYRGEVEPIDPVAGHIPGAVNLPWEGLVTAGRWASGPALDAALLPVADERDAIVYCGSGLTACAVILAMEVAGRPGAKLYPGGWSDWVSHPHLARA